MKIRCPECLGYCGVGMGESWRECKRCGRKGEVEIKLLDYLLLKLARKLEQLRERY